jgi:hypothetical protein
MTAFWEVGAGIPVADLEAQTCRSPALSSLEHSLLVSASSLFVSGCSLLNEPNSLIPL